MLIKDYNERADKIRDDALENVIETFQIGHFSDVYMVGSDRDKRRIQYGEIVKIVHFAEQELAKLHQEREQHGHRRG